MRLKEATPPFRGTPPKEGNCTNEKKDIVET